MLIYKFEQALRDVLAINRFQDVTSGSFYKLVEQLDLLLLRCAFNDHGNHKNNHAGKTHFLEKRCQVLLVEGTDVDAMG